MTTQQLFIGNPVSKLRRIGKERTSVATQLNDLPPELLDCIVSWLDEEQDFSPPSDPHRRLQFSIHGSPSPLKSLTLTCHSMHDLIIPRLFRFMRLKLDDSNDVEGQGIRKEVLIRFAALLAKYELQNKVHTVTVRFEGEKPILKLGQPLVFSSVVCGQILSAFYLETPTILAPLSVLPYLTYEKFWAPAEDKWEFVGSLHVLHSAPMAKEQAKDLSRDMQGISGLYSTQERSGLSMTSNIGQYGQAITTEKGDYSDMALDGLAKQIGWDWAPNLRELTYVAIFPTLDHIHDIYSILGQLENLESLALQFTPTGNLDILDNVARTRKCPISNIWLDVCACLIMTLSFVRNIDLTYSHRKLSILRFLDWYRYGTAMMLAHACEDYLPNFVFENGNWKKLKEGWEIQSSLRELSANSRFPCLGAEGKKMKRLNGFAMILVDWWMIIDENGIISAHVCLSFSFPYPEVVGLVLNARRGE